MESDFKRVTEFIKKNNYQEAVELLGKIVSRIKLVNEDAILAKKLLDELEKKIDPSNHPLVHSLELLDIQLVKMGVPFVTSSAVRAQPNDMFVLDVSNMYKTETSDLMKKLFLDASSPFSHVCGSVYGSKTDAHVQGPAAFSVEVMRKKCVSGLLFDRDQTGKEDNGVDTCIAGNITKRALEMKQSDTLFVFSGDGNSELKSSSIYDAVKTVVGAKKKVVLVGSFKNSTNQKYLMLAGRKETLTVMSFIEFYKSVMPSPTLLSSSHRSGEFAQAGPCSATEANDVVPTTAPRRLCDAWVAESAPDGRIYYFIPGADTDTRTWDFPCPCSNCRSSATEAYDVAPTTAPTTAPRRLCDAWVAESAPDGRIYYFIPGADTDTRTWDFPCPCSNCGSSATEAYDVAPTTAPRRLCDAWVSVSAPDGRIYYFIPGADTDTRTWDFPCPCSNCGSSATEAKNGGQVAGKTKAVETMLTMKCSGSTNYEKKYLKYKNKYIQLKLNIKKF
jgi:hypothetical protein